jgi:O-antigen/teichoic acid export membrane protein
MAFLGMPIAIVGAMLAGPIIRLLGDEEFVSRGTPTLALLLVAVAIRFVTATLSQGLIACHEQRFLFRLALVDLPINLVLNVVLGARFGAVGAATALIVSELIGWAIGSWWLSRKCGYRTPMVFFLRVLAPIAVSAGVVLLLYGFHVLLVIVAAIVAYLVGNLVFGPVGRSKLSVMLRGAADGT